MTNLVLPERLTLQARVWQQDHAVPYQGAPLVFGVRTFSRVKNDYHLGPIFTDAHGVAILTRSQLERYVAAELSSGLMDYSSIGDSYALVEIRLWSQEQIANTIEARTTVWTRLLEGEDGLFGSIESLLSRLRACGNSQFAPELSSPVRDEWDGARSELEYRCNLVRAAA